MPVPPVSGAEGESSGATGGQSVTTLEEVVVPDAFVPPMVVSLEQPAVEAVPVPTWPELSVGLSVLPFMPPTVLPGTAPLFVELVMLVVPPGVVLLVVELKPVPVPDMPVLVPVPLVPLAPPPAAPAPCANAPALANAIVTAATTPLMDSFMKTSFST